MPDREKKTISQDTGGVANKDGEVHNFRLLKKSVFSFLLTSQVVRIQFLAAIVDRSSALCSN
jgi:hypothetical protein